MQHENPTGDQGEKNRDVTLTEQVEQLAERVDALESENERLREENDELRERVEELEDDRDGARQARKTLFQRVNAPKDGDEGSDAPQRLGRPEDAALPIEQLARMSDEERYRHLDGSEERAITLWENLPDWGDYNSQSDRLFIKADKTLERLLNAERDGDAISDWNQRDRVLQAVERLSKGTADHRETNRHGWLLVVEQPGTVWPSKFPSGERHTASPGRR